MIYLHRFKALFFLDILMQIFCVHDSFRGLVEMFSDGWRI